jgi:SNF2 family DNA or RNA helicase
MISDALGILGVVVVVVVIQMLIFLQMGLGKTMQTIALMVSRPSTDPERKTNLIIAPVALLTQWKAEIKEMLNEKDRLSTFILHGGHGKKKLGFAALSQYDGKYRIPEYRIRNET